MICGNGRSGLSATARHYSALLGSLSVLARLCSAPPPERHGAAASPAHALTPLAVLRAALCLVFSLPFLQSCIRVVAFSIVSGKRPRTWQILGLLLLLVQANKVFLYFF